MNINRLVRLKPGEDVLMVAHQAIIPIIPKILLAFVWVVMPFFLIFPLFQLQAPGVLIFFIILISGLVYSVKVFLIWQNTIFIVTDRRMIDIDQRSLFTRVVSEAAYHVVRDVSYHIKGFTPTIFRYGTVIIQTEGNVVDLQVFRVSRPRRLHDLINDIRNGEYEEKTDDLCKRSIIPEE